MNKEQFLSHIDNLIKMKGDQSDILQDKADGAFFPKKKVLEARIEEIEWSLVELKLIRSGIRSMLFPDREG